VAENPLTWDIVERTIAKAMRKHEEAMKAGIVGGTSVKVIAEALREAGLCPPYDPSTCRKEWGEPL
jgi:hypothetical protein